MFHCICTAYKPSSLHASLAKGIKDENTKMAAQDTLIYSMMFLNCPHISTKSIQIHSNYVKSSDLIKPPRRKPRNSSKNTSSKFHAPSLRLAGEKVQVIETFNSADVEVCPSAKPWSAVTPSAACEAVDTEAAASSGVAAEDIHSIGRVAPHGRVLVARCGRCSARGQLTPAIDLAKVAQMFLEATSKPLTRNVCPKSNHNSRSTRMELATWP